MDGVLSIFQGILSTENNYLDIYLDGLEDHQRFSIQSGEAEEVVQNISSLLTKASTRALGLRLLNTFLDQCSTDVFERKANLWTTLVLKACNIQELQNVSFLLYEVLEKLAAKSPQIPDLSKSFISTHLPKIYDSLNIVPISGVKCALRCIETCLRLYPGSSGPSKGIVERFLWKFFDSLDDGIVVSCGKCFHLLQQVRGGGIQGVNHKSQWRNYQIQLLGSIHAVYNEMFSKCAEIYEDDTVQDQLPLTAEQLAYDDEPVKRAAQVYTRCHNLINYLIVALREPFPVEKPIQLKKILNVINRGLSVTCIMLEQNPIAENVAIGILLPKLHIDLLELLNTIIVILRGYLRPYSQLVLGVLMDTLKWTSAKNMRSNKKPLLKLRAKTYDTIALWCKILNSGSRCDSIAEYLYDAILNDVTPSQSEFTLKVLSGARKQMSKKARRQLLKAQNEQSKLSQSHSNDNSSRKDSDSEERNQLLCVSALRCAQEVLLSVANFMKPTVIKLVQTRIIQICAILYELTIKPTHLYHNYQCRIEIYNLLCVMIMTPHHLCPPPTEVVLTIIQTAHARDGSLKVRRHCSFILQHLEKIIHPQKESLLFLIEARDIRNTFIKMGKENLLYTSGINFSNTNDDHEDDELIAGESEEEAIIVDEEIESNFKEVDNMNDITDYNTNIPNKEIEPLCAKISEEDVQLRNSVIEDRSKSPEFVLSVEDDDADIAAINEEPINCEIDLMEPAIKRSKLQDGSEDLSKTKMKESVVTNMNSDGGDNNIEVDEDELLADIASQFVDELN